jgi:hypothetical protein
LAAKLADTEGRLSSSVAEAAGMQAALSELQVSGANKDEAVGSALRALEEQWSKQAQSLQQVRCADHLLLLSIKSMLAAFESRFA